MQRMSFLLTAEQVLSREKAVTRRLGWVNLKCGDRLCAIRKGQGLRAGERQEVLATIRVEDVRRERLDRLTADLDYGMREVALEGFGAHPTLRWPSAFVEFFCASHRPCTPASLVTRIVFSYVEK